MARLSLQFTRKLEFGNFDDAAADKVFCLEAPAR
jgi:hypothetical protein